MEHKFRYIDTDEELRSNKINAVLEAMDAGAPKPELDQKRLDLYLFLGGTGVGEAA